MNNKDQKKVAVLMGGLSKEREISLKSGQAVCRALSDSEYEVIPFVIEKKEEVEKLKSIGVDCIFIALHGGWGEDGTIQRILNEMNIPYTGSGPEASYKAMNKIESKKIFEQYNIPTPSYRTVYSEDKNFQFEGMDLPIVIKPSGQGSSIGLSIVREEAEMPSATQLAFKYSDQIIIEEYIEGREITAGILNNKPLDIIEIVVAGEFYDYRAKYDDKRTEYIIPAHLDKKTYQQAQKVAITAHKALGCDYFSRVDMRLAEDNNVYVLEVNTIPGLTSSSLLPKAAEACGINFKNLCLKIAEAASYNKKNYDHVKFYT
jgi:D-alanine-D-alanine ligase